MANLSTKIRIYVKEAGKTVDFGTNVFLQDDGNGAYIKEWNIEELAQPTEEQLNALESKATKLKNNNKIYATRKSEYPSIEECVHAILDDNLVALQEKRTAVKLKYPKENS